jgi:glycosyltransferase involved in cell wall biosynthesis
MKVLLISDFGIEHTPGGAQRSNQLIIEEGIKRGHKIHKLHYDSRLSPLLDEYDVVISSNLEVFSRVNQDLVINLTKLENHVRLEHDSNLYWNDSFREIFWKSCRVSFFLTEFHHSFFLEKYGNIFNNVKIVPDPIGEDFFDMGLQRTDEIGYVGFMHYLKGTDNFIEYVLNNPDKKFLIAGWGNESYMSKLSKFDNVEMLGKIEHEDMPKFYNRVVAIYYNPICNEPFCRAVGEAIMCGTEVIGGSSSIGSLEMYRHDPVLFRSKCINAAIDFWRILEKEVASW